MVEELGEGEVINIGSSSCTIVIKNIPCKNVRLFDIVVGERPSCTGLVLDKNVFLLSNW